MHLMATYGLMEAARETTRRMGVAAQMIGASPLFSTFPTPGSKILSAWGEVTERSCARMSVKPDWGITDLVGKRGANYKVKTEVILSRAFGDLIYFNVQGRRAQKRKILLVAPLSGHYATLLRATVLSLLPDADIYITDWHNARDIPTSEGTFDIEDYTLYLADFMRHLGGNIHVIAVCQPGPLALAATAYLAEEAPDVQPRSLTLIGSPIDPGAAATEVTDFGDRVRMDQLEMGMIQRVSPAHRGAGRAVYPGLLQLSSFIAMNAQTHAKAFHEQICKVSRGEVKSGDKHNKFYDEYLAVMDMPAEFYLSTVERIFKDHEIARNDFYVKGKRLDFGKIERTAVMTVEGVEDDITAPGQCVAALDLCTGISDEKKMTHVEPGAGHYGIFAGSSWRENIRPRVLSFIDAQE